VSRFGVRALLMCGAMIVACQDARDARASRAGDSLNAASSTSARGKPGSRDSVSGFTVPAQCAKGSVPQPKKPAPAQVAIKQGAKADSATLAHADSLRMSGARSDTVHIVGAWRDTTGAAGASRGDAPTVATTADTGGATRTSAAKPRSAKAARADSIARVRAKMHADSAAAIALQTDSAATHRLPGSLLPGCRIVAYYGNPMSRRMGILGEIQSDSMLARLAKQAAAYAAVDSARPVLPALELIATVAQASPGRSGQYRARMPDTLIERVMSWAEAHHYLVILDIQTGRSTMAAEM